MRRLSACVLVLLSATAAAAQNSRWTPAANTANPTAPGVVSFQMCWDGATWDPCSATGGSFDGVLLDAPGGDPITDTTNDAARVNVVAGTLAGGLAHDGAAASTNRVGTLPAITHNAAPTYTDGRNAALSVTTGGALRSVLTNAAGAPLTLASDATHGSSVSTAGPQLMLDGRSAEGTAVTSGQTVRWLGDLVGRGVVQPFAVPGDYIGVTPVGITDGSSTSVITAQGAGVRTYVTDIECTNSSASNVTVDIRDGTAGSVLWTMTCPANAGNNRTFSLPLRSSANTAIAADPSAAATTVTISMRAFKSTQ